MTAKNQPVQAVVLDALCAQQVPVTIFLRNGAKLQGNVIAFDDYALLLMRAGQPLLLYKHAMSTIVPGGPIRLRDDVAPDTPPCRSRQCQTASA